jgi:hypothetical protein
MNDQPHNHDDLNNHEAHENLSVPDGGRHVGPLIGILALVMLMTLGGLYIWSERQHMASDDTVVQEEPVDEDDEQTQRLQQQGASDDLDEIEQDLDDTDLDDLDREMTQIEAELEAEFGE